MVAVRRVPAGDLSVIRPVRSSELLVNELRRFVTVDASAGDVLPPERVLTEKFGVSRPTLREALRVLETEGLIIVKRGTHGGAVVCPPGIGHLTMAFGVFLQRTETELSDLFAARLVLEPAAAKTAAPRPPDEIQSVQAALDLEGRQMTQGTDDDVGRVTADFHEAVLQASGSRTLAALGNLLDAVIVQHGAASATAFGREDASTRADALHASHESHVHIAEAILSGDADAAERRARRHLEALHEATMAVLADATVNMFPRGDGHRP